MSSPELVARYLRQRARPRLFVPLAFAMAWVGAIISPSASVSVASFSLAAVQAFLLVMAFRVWDDLEDRGRDRDRRPARVMATDHRTVPFVALSLAFAVAAFVPMNGASGVRARLSALGVAVVVLLFWYRLRPKSGAGGYVVLIKYPLVSYAIVPGALPVSIWPRGIVVLAALYIAICFYEAVDDRSLRQSSSTPGLP